MTPFTEAQRKKMEDERSVRPGALHRDFPSTLDTAHSLSPKITDRIKGGIDDLWQLSAKLNEILDRIQGPRPPVACAASEELGLQGDVDRLRRLTADLNLTADEILVHL